MHPIVPHAGGPRQAVGRCLRRGDVHDLGRQCGDQVGGREMQVDPVGSPTDGDGRMAHGRRVDDDRPCPGRPERRDRPALVAGHLSGLVGVGQRQALDPEVRPHLRPVEAATARDQHEDVVVVRSPDHDRAQEGSEVDPLQLGAFLGAVGALGPDDGVWDAGRVDGVGRPRALGHGSGSASWALALCLPPGNARMRCRSRRWSCRTFGLGQDGRERLLAPCLVADRCVPGGVPGLGRFDERAAPVVRVGQAADEPGGLHPVEPVGHRPARKLEVVGQRAGRAAIRRADPAQPAEDPERAPIERELGERLRHRLVEIVGEHVDPLDDPFGLLVEVRDLPGPDRQCRIEVVEVVLRDQSIRASIPRGPFRRQSTSGRITPSEVS